MLTSEECVKNIQSLAKRQGIKLGDLEARAGISQGYLSRIGKKNGALPAAEALGIIAEELGVTVDFLLFGLPSSLSENERLVAEFIDALLGRTIVGRLEWTRDLEEVLNRTSFEQFNVTHPLCALDIQESDDFGGRNIYSSEYRSLFDCYAHPNGDGYHAELDSENSIYLMAVRSRCISSSDSGPDYEVYIRTRKELKPLCATCFVGETVVGKIRKLYDAVNTAHSHLGVDSSTRQIMNEFIHKNHNS